MIISECFQNQYFNRLFQKLIHIIKKNINRVKIMVIVHANDQSKTVLTSDNRLHQKLIVLYILDIDYIQAY